MRFSTCLRLVRSTGFFWGTSFHLYRTPFAGHRGATGYRTYWRRFVWRYGDGAFGRGTVRRLVYARTRFATLALNLLFFAPPHIPVPYLWALYLLRGLRLRTYRSVRYRLGLPSRGQRTRCNASTVSKHTDPAVQVLRSTFWRGRLWLARVPPKEAGQRGSKKTTKSKAKVAKKKGPVVRSKDKKKSV